MEVSRNWGIYVAIYIISAAAIYFILVLRERLNNSLLIALMISLAIPLLVYFIKLSPRNTIGSGLSRYTMKCNSCHWEWMSNISERVPDKCPKCQKNNLEVVGWRKVSVKQSKGNKNLKEFFE